MKKRLLSILLILTMIISSSSFTACAANSRVEEIISNMTLREKIEQMFMMDVRKWGDKDLTVLNDSFEDLIRDYNFGAIILFAENVKGTKQTFKLTQDLQAAAISDAGIPLMIATDQEGGKVYRLGSGTALPGNMAVAATGKTSNAYKSGKVIGSEVSALGINTTLAPVVDINDNPNNTVIGLRSYGDSASLVGKYAAQIIKGLSEYNVISCVKHFPGHGDTATDSHYGLPVVKKIKKQLLANELKPYKTVIKQGVDMVMTAHILYPKVEKDKVKSSKTGKLESLPATMSDAFVKRILKKEFGFKGIVCTDGMNMQGVTDYWNETQASINAIKAGVDMLCMPVTIRSKDDIKNLDKLLDKIVAAVNSGKIPESRINDACRRILKVKMKRGILDYDASSYSLEKAQSVVGCQENRDIEEQIAEAAVTLIRNKNKTIPLKITKSSKVLMMVPYSNEAGQMVMAWNRAKNAGLIPEGAKVKTVVFNADTEVDSYKDKLDWADTIIINSEIDKGSRISDKDWLYTGPKNFVNYAESKGKNTIILSVLVPYDVTLYTKADAVLAVYGCKGSNVNPEDALKSGITETKDACGPNIVAGVEACLGTFNPSGTLPVNVPKINTKTGKYTSKIKYKRGYGVK